MWSRDGKYESKKEICDVDLCVLEDEISTDVVVRRLRKLRGVWRRFYGK